MLNSNQNLAKNHFSQVAMIESQYESKRKNMLPNSSLLSNKSPMRDRQPTYNQYQNQNNMNTPSRMPAKNGRLPINNSSMIQNHGNNGSKLSLSPLRSRRNNQSSITSIKSTAVSRRKFTEPVCDQHKNKQAEFVLQSESQYFYFCQTCAIPLIAQGFPCTKLQSNAVQQEVQNPRIQQINQFLKSTQQVTASLLEKKARLNRTSENYNQILDTEKDKISDYYEQIHELVNQHMSRVMQQLQTEFKKSAKLIEAQQIQVDEASKNLKQMKDDILTSMNSVVVQASENDYRSVMEQYYGNLDDWRKLKINQYNPDEGEGRIRKLVFGEIDPVLEGVTQVLSKQLVVEWDDDIDQQPYQDCQSDKLLGTTKKMLAKNQLESERENPIQCLETQERNKSNLKELGGLFCSFDD